MEIELENKIMHGLSIKMNWRPRGGLGHPCITVRGSQDFITVLDGIIFQYPVDLHQLPHTIIRDATPNILSLP